MRNEYFISIDKTVEHSLNVKKSKFLAHAEPVFDIKSAKHVISNISYTYRNADHNCWAYRIGDEVGYSDGGEPSGTAGKPILLAIQRAGLNAIVVVVTRYFGGIKLGKRGLIDAYFEAAFQAIEKASRVKYFPFLVVNVKMNYEGYEKFIKFVSKRNFKVKKKDFNFSEHGLYGRIEIPENEYDVFCEKMGKYAKIEIVNRVYFPLNTS